MCCRAQWFISFACMYMRACFRICTSVCVLCVRVFVFVWCVCACGVSERTADCMWWPLGRLPTSPICRLVSDRAVLTKKNQKKKKKKKKSKKKKKDLKLQFAIKKHTFHTVAEVSAT
ncbi:unnamed protein product [Ceratitis capitata]|uniref:(Mediterranean fruit fly) hypothetical protein n=1 Tax=Ceratitis capitata TaxID=7213 RepID=A0A811VEY7_CERCA|nr:unnamed protein product [Ceratitis capitata]